MRWLWSSMRMMSVEGVMLWSVMILLRCEIESARVVSIGNVHGRGGLGIEVVGMLRGRNCLREIQLELYLGDGVEHAL